MALVEIDMFGTRIDKIQRAIDRLRAFEPPEGYYVAFSGGKDSQCIYHLCKAANVRFDAHYCVTSVDPPELVRFIREQYPDVAREIPHDKDGKPITMWSLIEKNGILPTRIMRYCCAELKESRGMGRVTVTGVRWAESVRRRKKQSVVNVFGGTVMNSDNDEARRYVEQCYRTRKTLVNPIVDWTDDDVWEYLDDMVHVPHCCLYDEGFKRLGCIGCPMSGVENRKKEFERWPKYYDAYLRALARALPKKPKKTFPNAQSMMDWWMKEVREKPIEGQIEMEFEGDQT